MRFAKWALSLTLITAVVSPSFGQGESAPPRLGVVLPFGQVAPPPIKEASVLAPRIMHLGTSSVAFIDENGKDDVALAVMAAVRDDSQSPSVFTVHIKYLRVKEGGLVEFDKETLTETDAKKHLADLETLQKSNIWPPDSNAHIHLPHGAYRYQYTRAALQDRSVYLKRAAPWIALYRSLYPERNVAAARSGATPAGRPESSHREGAKATDSIYTDDFSVSYHRFGCPDLNSGGKRSNGKSVVGAGLVPCPKCQPYDFHNNRASDSPLEPVTPDNSSADLAPTYPGGDVHVRGYYRKDGTYVPPHTRSRPDR